MLGTGTSRFALLNMSEQHMSAPDSDPTSAFADDPRSHDLIDVVFAVGGHLLSGHANDGWGETTDRSSLAPWRLASVEKRCCRCERLSLGEQLEVAVSAQGSYLERFTRVKMIRIDGRPRNRVSSREACR